ncbi:Uncharacterised protein [Vibrio cholerae]|nr:Uncharacterised protein [Vibrio cholerae]
MATFFHRSQLVFKVNASSARFNHGFHQLISVEYAAKTGFRIRHNRQEVINTAFILW